MNTDEFEPLDTVLDAALARALIAPVLPAGFPLRLQAALSRQASGAEERAHSRVLAQREQRARMAELDADYLQLRRRTLGTLIGGAFAAGAAVAVAFPWLQASFGANGIYVLAGLGAVVGLGIGTASWIGRLRWPKLLERL